MELRAGGDQGVNSRSCYKKQRNKTLFLTFSNWFAGIFYFAKVKPQSNTKLIQRLNCFVSLNLSPNMFK